jgi:hypothetical protein
MADPPPYPGTPRWVKVFAIIAAAVILAFVFQLVTEGPMRPGMPGMPGMHGGGGNAPSSSITALGADGGHNPSEWGH